MSGRRREGLAPTLFPFLAVLVCTLGTLILLLALVAQNAGDAIASSSTQPPEIDAVETAAEAARQAEQIAAAQQIERQLREARWHREQTVAMRDEQTAELEQRRDALAHLEDHLQRLREELRLLTTEVEKSIDDSGDLVETQQTLDRLINEIEQERDAIANLDKDLQSQTPRIVIVPHKGPNGTDRRPIYIECRQDGVYLQPGERSIALADLESEPGLPNPLDAALRAIRLHALRDYGDSIAPYPLLIVRPAGIDSYSAARGAMRDWDDQFGYELVPDGVELAFPTADPVLDAKVATAIKTAIDQRQSIIARSPRGGRGRGGSTQAAFGRHRSGSGGPAESGASEPAGDSTDNLAGGRRIGDPGDTASRPGTVNGTASNDTGGDRSAESRSPTAKPLPVLSAAKMSRGDSSGALGVPRNAFAGSAGNSAFPDEPIGGGLDQPMLGPATDSTAANANQLATKAAGAGPAAGTGDTGQNDAMTDAAADGDRSHSGSNFATATTAAGATSVAAGNETADVIETGTAAVEAESGTSTQGSGTMPGSAASRTGSGGPQAAGTPTESSDMGTTDDSDQGSPNMQMTATTTPPVTRVGKDWALPPAVSSSRGTEMLRTLRVECHPNRFVLLAEGGRGAPKTFLFTDGNINQASLELATAVRDRVDRWGAGLPGGRWQPVLDVAVVIGGEQSFQELVRLLDGSGLLIQARGTR